MRPTKADLAPWLWGIGITALLLLPLPTGAASMRWPALVRDLTEYAHPVAFAWFAHVLFRSLRTHMPRPSAGPYLWVAAGVVVYGATTELVQALVDRQPSLIDFRNDMLGAVFAMMLHWRKESGVLALRIALACAAAIVGIAASKPLAWTLTAYANRWVQAPVLWQADSRLFGHFSSWDEGDFPVLRLREPMADWRGWGHLEVDIENPQGQPHPVVVRVHDLWHDLRHRDRYNERFTLQPGTRQTLHIALDNVRTAPEGREMDMNSIRGIVVYSAARDPVGEFRVHQIRLAP